MNSSFSQNTFHITHKISKETKSAQQRIDEIQTGKQIFLKKRIQMLKNTQRSSLVQIPSKINSQNSNTVRQLQIKLNITLTPQPNENDDALLPSKQGISHQPILRKREHTGLKTYLTKCHNKSFFIQSNQVQELSCITNNCNSIQFPLQKKKDSSIQLEISSQPKYMHNKMISSFIQLQSLSGNAADQNINNLFSSQKRLNINKRKIFHQKGKTGDISIKESQINKNLLPTDNTTKDRQPEQKQNITSLKTSSRVSLGCIQQEDKSKKNMMVQIVKNRKINSHNSHLDIQEYTNQKEGQIINNQQQQKIFELERLCMQQQQRLFEKDQIITKLQTQPQSEQRYTQHLPPSLPARNAVNDSQCTKQSVNIPSIYNAYNEYTSNHSFNNKKNANRSTAQISTSSPIKYLYSTMLYMQTASNVQQNQINISSLNDSISEKANNEKQSQVSVQLDDTLNKDYQNLSPLREMYSFDSTIHQDNLVLKKINSADNQRQQGKTYQFSSQLIQSDIQEGMKKLLQRFKKVLVQYRNQPK